MDNRQTFHNIFTRFNFPSYVDEDYIYSLFELCLYLISPRIEKEFDAFIPNPHVMLNYIVDEYNFLVEPLNEKKRKEMIQDEELKKFLANKISNKIIFNEYVFLNHNKLISKYNPVISDLQFYMNFVFNKLESLTFNKDVNKLIVDLIKHCILSIRGSLALLIEGLETEAFATWRLVHETECILKIIYENQYIIDTYKHHIEFNLAFRDKYEDKVLQQSLIDEVKGYLKEHNLKSKDLKKYIEYGWLYAIKDVEKNYDNFKLNFRNGIQNVAKLSQYSSTYEMSSEIAHASPLFIYSNKKYFLHRCLIALYESFLRIDDIAFNFMTNEKKEESTELISMRSSYREELELILAKEKYTYTLSFKD